MIAEWTTLIIIILVVILLLKIGHHTEKYKIAALLLIILTLYLLATGIFSLKQIDQPQAQKTIGTLHLYLGWIGETSLKLWNVGTDTAHIVGNAIKTNNTNKRSNKA